MLNLKTKVTPAIKRATGTISISCRKYLSNIPRKHDIKELYRPRESTNVKRTKHSPHIVITE